MAMMIEHDCDTRALNKIREYGLEDLIPLDEYIQRANCYHASFRYFYIYQCFIDHDHSPYERMDIMDLFPTDHLLSAEHAWQPTIHSSINFITHAERNFLYESRTTKSHNNAHS